MIPLVMGLVSWRVGALLAIGAAGCRPDSADTGKGRPSAPPLADAATPHAVSNEDAGAAALPRVDARCAADADCVAVGFEVEGPRGCCLSCGSTAVNRTWASVAGAMCTPARLATLPCPPLACPQGTRAVHCERETCVLGVR